MHRDLFVLLGMLSLVTSVLMLLRVVGTIANFGLGMTIFMIIGGAVTIVMGWTTKPKREEPYVFPKLLIGVSFTILGTLTILMGIFG